jgi:hypothetical protein
LFVGRGVQAGGRGDGSEDVSGVGDGGEVHKPDAVGVIVEGARGDLKGKAGLAAATGAGEGDQARASQQTGDLGYFEVAPDEAGNLERQVCWVAGDGCLRA